MPILIGEQAQPGFDQPLELMSDCHRRIERFLSILSTIADSARCDSGAPQGPLNQQQREALATALRYFREAAPKHTDDEEVSLFPRIRAAGTPESRDVLHAIDELNRQHQDAAAWHQELDQLGLRWLEHGEAKPGGHHEPAGSRAGLTEADFERLRDLLVMLRRLYQEHIAVEDNEIFPAAARILNSDQLREIGCEMAARRGLSPEAQSLPQPES